MLDPSMAYSCGYWAQAESLEAAQAAKLDLICQKLQLRPGMSLLDIGCGWGSLMLFAARHYGVQCVGLTVSNEQAGLGAVKAGDLPVRFELTDYRQFNPQGLQRFDRVASVGMSSLKVRYGERFYRMWRYYLLCCAGTFRARDNQLWQVVLSPRGLAGGYRRPRV